jgi:hypothetical protein
MFFLMALIASLSEFGVFLLFYQRMDDLEKRLKKQDIVMVKSIISTPSKYQYKYFISFSAKERPEVEKIGGGFNDFFEKF